MDISSDIEEKVGKNDFLPLHVTWTESFSVDAIENRNEINKYRQTREKNSLIISFLGVNPSFTQIYTYNNTGEMSSY